MVKVKHHADEKSIIITKIKNKILQTENNTKIIEFIKTIHPRPFLRSAKLHKRVILGKLNNFYFIHKPKTQVPEHITIATSYIWDIFHLLLTNVSL